MVAAPGLRGRVYAERTVEPAADGINARVGKVVHIKLRIIRADGTVEEIG